MKKADLKAVKYFLREENKRRHKKGMPLLPTTTLKQIRSSYHTVLVRQLEAARKSWVKQLASQQPRAYPPKTRKVKNV